MYHNRHLVFVYGTLRRGLRLHGYLSAAAYIADATVFGVLYDLGRYPAIVLEDSGKRVVGEVWSVNDETLRILDRVEGYDVDSDSGLYLRKTVSATSIEEICYHAHVYVGNMNLSNMNVVDTGDTSDYKIWLADRLG